MWHGNSVIVGNFDGDEGAFANSEDPNSFMVVPNRLLPVFHMSEGRKKGSCFCLFLFVLFSFVLWQVNEI